MGTKVVIKWVLLKVNPFEFDSDFHKKSLEYIKNLSFHYCEMNKNQCLLDKKKEQPTLLEYFSHMFFIHMID